MKHHVLFLSLYVLTSCDTLCAAAGGYELDFGEKLGEKLMEACSNMDEAEVRSLLDQKASVNHKGISYNSTPLISLLAAAGTSKIFWRELTNMGIVCEYDCSKFNAVAQLLLEQKADPNQTVDSCYHFGLPLGMAASANLNHVVQLLLDHKADAAAKDGNGDTALMTLEKTEKNEIAENFDIVKNMLRTAEQ